MSVSRDQILNLLEQTLEGHGLIGGRRKPRRSRSMPPRRRSMRGRGDEEMVIEFDEMPTMNRYASVGNGLIGGRKSKTKSKSKRMSAATKAYLAEYRRMHPRRRRGRGLIGGSAQEFFNELVDEYLQDNPSATLRQAENYADNVLESQKSRLKLGVAPTKTKESLIRAIRSLERKLGMPESITTHLKSLKKDRLATLLKTLQKEQATFMAPTYSEMREAEDEDRKGDRYDFSPYYEIPEPTVTAAEAAAEAAAQRTSRRQRQGRRETVNIEPTLSGVVSPSESKTTSQLKQEEQKRRDKIARDNLRKESKRLGLNNPFTDIIEEHLEEVKKLEEEEKQEPKSKSKSKKKPKSQTPQTTDEERLRNDKNRIAEFLSNYEIRNSQEDVPYKLSSEVYLYLTSDKFVKSVVKSIGELKMLIDKYTFKNKNFNKRRQELWALILNKPFVTSGFVNIYESMRKAFPRYPAKWIREIIIELLSSLMMNPDFTVNFYDSPFINDIIEKGLDGLLGINVF